ncbi:acyltransferase family protein [uncultured Bacteroides sp.]|uniref:acyltransferase family protein n=1 Tax=uncultured Bacteroides sp. TaxID=162156 RepID=UPI00262AA3FD|nr:acyltransferase family protein [uncultured Bacteroides sp.]
MIKTFEKFDVNSRQKENRLPHIDIMKGFAIFFVVMGHVIAWWYPDFSQNINLLPFNSICLWKFIYSFHMALFLFISGYVAFNPNKTYTVKKTAIRIFSYLIPFISIGILLHFFRGSVITNYWYLRTLSLFIIVLFLFIKVFDLIKVKKRYIIDIALVILYILIFQLLKYICTLHTICDLIFDGSHLIYAIFFISGWILRKYNTIEIYVASDIIASISFIFMFLYLITGYPLLDIKIHSFLCIFFFLNISKKIESQRLASYLKHIGTETLAIYLLHFFFTIKLHFLGQYLINYSNADLSTSLSLQLFIGTLITTILIKCSVFVYNMLNKNQVLSVILFGEIKKYI